MALGTLIGGFDAVHYLTCVNAFEVVRLLSSHEPRF